MDWSAVGTWAQVIVVPLTVAVGWMIRSQIAMGTKITELTEWKKNHQETDQRTHERLETGDREILAEVVAIRGEINENIQAMRTESTSQHATLGGKLDDVAKEGREGRRAIHQEVQEMGKVVARLVGRAEVEDRDRSNKGGG